MYIALVTNLNLQFSRSGKNRRTIRVTICDRQAASTPLKPPIPNYPIYRVKSTTQLIQKNIYLSIVLTAEEGKYQKTTDDDGNACINSEWYRYWHRRLNLGQQHPNDNVENGSWRCHDAIAPKYSPRDKSLKGIAGCRSLCDLASVMQD